MTVTHCMLWYQSQRDKCTGWAQGEGTTKPLQSRQWIFNKSESPFLYPLVSTGVKIPLRRKHGNMNEERCMEVKLVNIHRLEFTMSQVRTTSKHTCTSAKATRGRAQPLKDLWHNLCPSLSSGSAFPLYKSCVRVITGALASCWRKPWWPQHSSALSPRRGSDCCRVCSLAQTQSVSSLEGLRPKSQLERKCRAASFVADKM